jgi:hypothetical protein
MISFLVYVLLVLALAYVVTGFFILLCHALCIVVRCFMDGDTDLWPTEPAPAAPPVSIHSVDPPATVPEEPEEQIVLKRNMYHNTPLCRGLVALIAVATLLGGCLTPPYRSSWHGQGVNRLDAEDMRLYRLIWGEWLEQHRYRPRPEPQKIAGTFGGWTLVCNRRAEECGSPR